MLRTKKLKHLILSSWQLGGFRFSGKANIPAPAIFSSVNENGYPYSWRPHNYVANHIRSFSTTAETVLVQACDPAKLCIDIQKAVNECRYGDSWRLFEQHMQMEGFPRKSVVNLLIAGYAETLDPLLLNQAFGLVEQAFEKGKHSLFEQRTLIYLALALSKSGLLVPASFILRELIRIEEYPPVAAWSAVLANMALSSSSGAFLAAELVLEIAHLFKDNKVNPSKKSNAPLVAMKPDTLTFSVALAGCLVFGTTKIAEELLEMMPRLCVKADTTLLLLKAHIYERNGIREEFKNLKRHIDKAHDLNDTQFRQFYNCLLNCHLKFGDLDSASQMVLEMLHKAKEAQNSLAAATLVIEPATKRIPSTSTSMDLSASDKIIKQACQFLSYEDLYRDRNFTSLQGKTREILVSLLLELEKQTDLLISERGVLQPTDKIYVKLAKGFLEAGKIKELTEFLIKVERNGFPSADDSALVHVINSCISLDWLDKAHDILDEMRFAGFRTSSSVYSSLLKAYCKADKTSEVMSLLREVRRAGIQLDASCYEALIDLRVQQKDSPGALSLFKEMKEAKIPRAGHEEFDVLVETCAQSGEVGFMAKLLQEIKEGERVDCGVHDWNNMIHFFCKKRMIRDAEKAFRKMNILGHNPNAQTFHSMVTAYAAIGGNYKQVTDLWDQMNSLAAATQMKFDQELLDSILYTFVRGGFFLRAHEVKDMMEKKNMFIDKYRYRSLFMKYHKTLNKGKPSKSESEAKRRKREAVLSFKKWVGLF